MGLSRVWGDGSDRDMTEPAVSGPEGSSMGWVLRLAETGPDAAAESIDLIEIHRSSGLADIANLGLTLSEAKELLARAQQAMVAAQARNHAVYRPSCASCAGQCQLKDWRPRRIATQFGEVAPRLRRWLCAHCGRIETGIDWPENCRSTPELERTARAFVRPVDLQGRRRGAGPPSARGDRHKPGDIAGPHDKTC